MSVLEIVFVGQCEVFVLILYIFFFSLAAKLIDPRMGCQFFKKCLFFPTLTPLKSAPNPWSPGGSFMVQKMDRTSPPLCHYHISFVLHCNFPPLSFYSNVKKMGFLLANPYLSVR